MTTVAKVRPSLHHLRFATIAGSRVQSVAGGIALAGTLSCVGALLVLHLLPTGLSPVRNAVSQYGIKRYRAGYRVQTIAIGVAATASAVGIADLHLSGGPVVVVLLLLFGVGRLVISWFPMDEPGGERTKTGQRHGLLAGFYFFGATASALRLGFVLGRSRVWIQVSGAIVGLGVAMAVLILAMGLSRQNPGLRRSFGLIERGFYLAAIAFLCLTSVQLLTTS